MMQNQVIFRFSDVTVKYRRMESGQPWSVEIVRNGRSSTSVRLDQWYEPNIPNAFRLYSKWVDEQTAEHVTLDC